MKLVTFSVTAPFGLQRRLGALVDQDRVVDLTTAYATYLAQRTDEPTPRELALLRVPPDLMGWLRGQHKSREAAEQALAFVGEADADARGLDDARLVFRRNEVALLAPLPRSNSLRGFSIFEEHMTRREDGPITKRASWYRWPPYYKGNPDAIIGPEDPIPFPYYTEKLDLELELGIIVGRAGRNFSLDEARAAIAGCVQLICIAGHQIGQGVRFEVSGIGVLEHTIVAGTGRVDYVKNGINGLLQAPSGLVGGGSGGRA